MAAMFSAMGLNRPNTVRFNTHHLTKGVTPQDVYNAVNHELDTTTTIVCIAELERKWYNVTFDNEEDCECIAQQGMLLHNALIQCERANVRNSVVAYIKAPYEIPDQTITSLLSRYGTVVNIRRQLHGFDDKIETGVRSCLIKSLKKPIPSFIKFSGFTLPVRYKWQQKTCKICEETDHLARDCPVRSRCFVCGSYNHRAAWHDQYDGSSEQEETYDDTPIIKVGLHKENKNPDVEATTGEKEENDEQHFDSTEPPAKEETTSSKTKKGEERKGMEQTDNTEQRPPKEATSKLKKSFKEVVAGTTTKKTPQKPQGFWDAAMTSQATNKASRKRKATEAQTESSKIARDESIPANMEILADDNQYPVDETPEHMDDQEQSDERSDNVDTEEENSSGMTGVQTSDNRDQSHPETAITDEDPEGEFVPYMRGGVQRFRKKRLSWARKPTDDSEPTTSSSQPSQERITRASKARGAS